MNEDGARRLVYAIVAQAVEDYRVYEARGIFHRGELNVAAWESYARSRREVVLGKPCELKKTRLIRTRAELEQLLLFLHRDLDGLCEDNDLVLKAPYIRRKLGFGGGEVTARTADWDESATNQRLRVGAICSNMEIGGSGDE